jgi:hypothetical protein
MPLFKLVIVSVKKSPSTPAVLINPFGLFHHLSYAHQKLSQLAASPLAFQVMLFRFQLNI